MKIVSEPNPILRKVTEPVEDVQAPHLKELIDDMVYTMRKANGIGLAANQVGIDARIFVIDTNDGAIALFNPEITKRSNKTEVSEEGCLSVPGKYGPKKRHYAVTVRGFDEEGEEVEYDAEGLFARVIQHEMDHLNGILYIDDMEDFTQDQKKDVLVN